MAEFKFGAVVLLVLPLALAACSDGGASDLASCQAELADLQAEREAFVNDEMGGAGNMRTQLDGGEVSLEELERFAEMRTRLDEFENRLAVQQQRCDELAAGQE